MQIATIRATLILSVFIVLFFPACKTGQLSKEKSISEVSLENNPVDRFLNNVVGLKKGDTIEKAFEIFGEPTEHFIHDDGYSFSTVYYNIDDKDADDRRALSFSYFKETRKIYTIKVGRGAAVFLRQKNVKDRLYIDVHADEIRKIFGPKKFGHVGNLEYENVELQVNFNCYDFNNYKCFDYTIYWWN